jgi:Flp pilus assembly pilin Flp
MFKFIKNFHKNEAGAVTVDWVVLTAAVVGLAVAAYASIKDGSTALTENTEDYMDAITPGSVGTP